MAYYASSTWPLSFLRMRPRLLCCKSISFHHNCLIVSATKKKSAMTEPDDVSDGDSIDISSKSSKKQTRRGRPRSSKTTTEEIIPVEAATKLTVDERQLWIKDQPENADISPESNKKPSKRGRPRKSSKKTKEEIIPVEAEAATELTGDEEQLSEKSLPENADLRLESNKKTTRRGRPKSSKKIREEVVPVEAATELAADEEELSIKNLPENVDISSENNNKETRASRKRSSKKSAEEVIPVEANTEFNEDQMLKSWVGHSEITTEPTSPTKEIQNENFYVRNVDPSERNMDLSFLEVEDECESENDMKPPLVICFGPAKVSFIPYARPAKRIFDQEIHAVMTDLYWSPDQFFRAPGSAASSVAIALAELDGQVEFMGKLGHDSLGKEMFSALEVYGVQTKCTKIDDSAATAVSHMKLTADRNHLKAKCVRPSAEDTFLKSDINLDVLKEAKMLYFNSSALLDLKSKSTLMEVIRIMKSQGSLIFFDVNLPLPLWHSSEEAKTFLMEAFALSNFIELTQQELDFLCGIEQNVMGNKRDVELVHRNRKRVEEFWHDDLEVLFVTNGTSGVSYYTKESDEYFVGTEDIQIEPSSCEMSAAGDALVAALMKMLVSEPDMATDPSYLETSIWSAIESGMIAQSLVTGESGFYDNYQHDEDYYDHTVTTPEDSEELLLERAG